MLQTFYGHTDRQSVNQILLIFNVLPYILTYTNIGNQYTAP